MAIDALTRLDLPERLTTTHAAYARVLEARGETLAALRQWRLAVAATHPEAAYRHMDRTEGVARNETA